MPKSNDLDEIEQSLDDLDNDPIPAKRDTRIFQIKKDKDSEDKEKDEDFEEDVFV
jgi:hypothetical protein